MTVESVEESDEEESDDKNYLENGSPTKRSKLGDHRFHTARQVSMKGGASRKKVGFSEDRPDEMDYEEEFDDFDEIEREQLFSKIRHGHQDWVKQYITKKKSDLSKNPIWSIDANGNTLLHVAVQNNHRKIASMLIKEGCEVNKTNKKGMTCLDYAELYHFQKMAEFLQSMDALNGTKR